MTDEKYVFINDCKDKKRTASGAHHKRTHCGKGGAIMFPSDYLTNKEKKAMNGKCETYRMNDPMTWAEFKKMPKDLQKTYIICLRKQFGVTVTQMAEMFGAKRGTIAQYIDRTLGLGLGKGKRPGKCDMDAWTRWLNRVPAASEPVVEITEEVQEYIENDIEMTEKVAESIKDIYDAPSSDDYVRIPHYDTENKAIIRGGRLSLEGNLYHIMTRLINIIGDVNVEMTVSWDLKED